MRSFRKPDKSGHYKLDHYPIRSHTMHRYIPAAGLLALASFLILAATDRGDAQANQWGTIKGRVVWGGAVIPARKEIAVTVNPEHCLKDNPTADAKKGTILDESQLIDAKDKGFKN